jgi:hypothetical protein
MMDTRPTVTDHAVLRYLERGHGVDIAAIRAHIESLCLNGLTEGASAVAVENVKFALIDGRVVTCVDRHQMAFPGYLKRAE